MTIKTTLCLMALAIFSAHNADAAVETTSQDYRVAAADKEVLMLVDFAHRRVLDNGDVLAINVLFHAKPHAYGGGPAADYVISLSHYACDTPGTMGIMSLVGFAEGGRKVFEEEPERPVRVTNAPETGGYAAWELACTAPDSAPQIGAGGTHTQILNAWRRTMAEEN